MASGLEAELHCAICLDLYQNPHILPCQHSFCHLCLSEVLRAPPDSGTGILCPSCRKNWAIGTEGIDAIPRNFMLASIVDKFKESKISTQQKEESQMATPCDLCEGDTKEDATKHCIQCGASYCEQCFKIFHPMRGPFVKHNIKTPAEAAATSSPRVAIACPDHEGKELDMYCVPCERPICYLCDRVGGHHEHKVCDIQQAFTQRKANFIQRSSILREKKKQQDMFIKELQQGQEVCKNNYTKVDQEVSKEFEKLYTTLKSTETSVRSHLVQRKQHKLATLTTQIQTTAAASAKIVDMNNRIEDVLKESDPVSFLLDASLLEKSLKESEDVQMDLRPSVGYDFSLIRNYDKCLQFAETLAYEGVKVLPAKFDTVNMTKLATIERNVMRYEMNEYPPETAEDFEDVLRPLVQRRHQRRGPVLEYPCAATLNEPLAVGYNYVVIRIHSTSHNQQARQIIPAAIAFCYSPSDQPPKLETLGNESICQMFKLGFARRKAYKVKYKMSSNQDRNDMTCKLIIRLDDASGPGILAIDRSSPMSEDDKPPTRAPTSLQVPDSPVDIYRVCNFDTESPQPTVIYLDDHRDTKRMLGVQPGMGRFSQKVPQAKPNQSSSGGPSKLYLAFCLNSHEYSIEVIENATLCPKLSTSMFNFE